MCGFSAKEVIVVNKLSPEAPRMVPIENALSLSPQVTCDGCAECNALGIKEDVFDVYSIVLVLAETFRPLDQDFVSPPSPYSCADDLPPTELHTFQHISSNYQMLACLNL